MNQDIHNGRTVATILADTKEEIKQFVQTRFTMLRLEVNDKLQMLKLAAPLAALGILLLTTAYLLFTLSLVGLVLAFLHNNPYRWCLAFLAIAVVWTILGGFAGYLAKREFALKELVPKKTIRVLKEDKLWVESEVKTQI